MNIIKFLTTAILLFMAVKSINAQNGGSAYVYVEDNNGNKKCITVIIECSNYNSSIPKTKEQLLNSINKELKYNSFKKISSVNYSIDNCSDYENIKKNGGTASVRVQNKKGKTRWIEVNAHCRSYSSVPKTKKRLLNLIDQKIKYTGEVKITNVAFNIDPCD